MLDMRLPDGSRLSAVMNLSARPALSIRRHRLLTGEHASLDRLTRLYPTAAVGGGTPTELDEIDERLQFLR